MKALLPILVLMAVPPVFVADQQDGYLMPFACRNRSQGTVQDHSTACALEEDCVASGFGLLSGETFKRFDPAGHLMALEYFRSTERTHNHRVRVVGDFSGETIVVQKIEPLKD